MDEQQALQAAEALYVVPDAEITEDNTRLDPETETWEFDDAAALKLICDDETYCDNFMNTSQWSGQWTFADLIFQSPQASSVFDGGSPVDANVPKFTVSNHISSIVPKMVGSIFYEDPPFLLLPEPSTTPEIVRAKNAIFSNQLWDMKFEEEAERAMDQMALLGTCIMKWGYTHYVKKEKKRVRVEPKFSLQTPVGTTSLNTPQSNDFKVEKVERNISRPWIKYCDIRSVLVDPGCRYGDIRRAGYVIYRDYASYDDLSRLRDVEGYDIPSEDILKAFFLNRTTPAPDNISMTLPEGMRGYLQHATPRNTKTTADAYKNGLEILERWDDDKVIVVLRFNSHNILIRNEANPYSVKPFYSANWRNIPDAFYGQGLGLLIGNDQLVEQGVTNLALGLLAYGLQPTAVRKKGFNAPTQQIRWKQGGIIDVDEDVDKAFKFLQMPPVPGEAWSFINQAQQTAASTSGANEIVGQGGSTGPGRGTGMRNATGAAAVVAANASRLDGPSGRFIRQIFEPWLHQMDDLNNDLMPTAVLYDILGEELGREFKIDHMDFRESKFDYQVLAGAHLGPKKEMAQMLPFVLQLVNNPTFSENVANAGYEWDGVAIFKNICDVGGYKFSQDMLKKMTPEAKQRHQANSPAALQQQKLQAAQTAQTAQFQHEEQLEDEKQLGKAGNEILRQTIEKAGTNEEVEGVPGNTGFGDNQ